MFRWLIALIAVLAIIWSPKITKGGKKLIKDYYDFFKEEDTRMMEIVGYYD